MNSYYLTKDDYRGRELYEKLLENEIVENDYFTKNKDSVEELEQFFKTNRYYFSSNSEKVKIKLLYRLKNFGLTIYEYFDLTELYFNKYYYGLTLDTESEEKIKKYFTF